ncbi:TKL protein kinase, variant [Aphanomyces invadans]|uniref:TKL protein kinase, variant n=1 Tax=Aphanomyces invadans TaxID=157072 RepID=A0A024UNV7_9STRA|nr:TKL protein kinase, variant [Aphanomyces invadans]ETW07313.1 TKL protein kinase, variant [Aphanomyces invadans]|eukprot:XP_008863406.1 TKL protein kinase, variant [Aphanomyces invadans]
MADACTMDHLGSCPTTCSSPATNNACIRFPNRINCKQGDLCKSFPTNETCGVQYACQPTVVIGTDFTFTVASNELGSPNRAIIGNIFGYALPPTVTGAVTLTGISTTSTRRKVVVDPWFFSVAKPTSFVVDSLDVSSLSLTSLPASITTAVYKNGGVTDISAVPLGPGVTSLSLEGNNSPIPTFPDPSSSNYAKLAGLTRLDLTNCQLSSIAWIFPPKLEHLVLTKNTLSRIPPTVFGLNLTTLSLGENPLGSTPISASEFESLKRIKQLILPSIPPTTCDSGSTLQAIQNIGSLCVSAPTTSPSSSTGLIVGISVGGVVVLALFIAVFVYRRKKQRPATGYNPQWSPGRPQRRSTRSMPRPSVRQSEMMQHGSGPGRKSAGTRGSEPMSRYTSSTGHTNQNNYPFGPFTTDKETSQSYFAGNHTGTHTNRSTISISDALNPAIPVLEADDMVYTRVLGRGAKGVVWLATYAGQACAVKKLTDLTSNEDDALGNLIVETNLLFRIQHPRIIGVLGVVLEANAPGQDNMALVMEFMDKGDLFECLQRTKANKDAPGVGWAGEKGTFALHIAEGLASLHTRSPPIIHRDIKARNVLVDSVKGAKICDFGESRARTFEETMTSNVGTARWIAPEVLINEDYSEKADIYSFGVLLSELDTHAIPYSDSTLEERQIMQMVAVNRLRPTFSPNCPEQIQHLARHCMQADPSNRPDATRLVKTIMTILGSFVAL